jgi:hypothetical protein
MANSSGQQFLSAGYRNERPVKKQQACFSRVEKRCSIETLFVAMLFALLFGGSGCSIIGHAIGAYSDRSGIRPICLRADSALGILSTGDSIIVDFHSAESLRGIYLGTGVPTADMLPDAIQAAATMDDASGTMVLPGERLLLERPHRDPEWVIFVAAEPQRLLYFDSTRSMVRPLLYEYISRLSRGDGRVIEKPYRNRVADGTFDRVISMRLGVDSGVCMIDTTTIRTIQFRQKPTSGRALGFLIGAIFDIVAIQGILNFQMDIWQ